jgi:transposase
MVDVRRTKDIEALRQIAVLQDNELRRLNDKLNQAMMELGRLKGHSDADLQRQLIELQEQLAAQQHRLYGASSERRGTKDTGDAKGAKERKGHGPKAQPDLPIDIVVHELDEADQQCVKCGGKLAELGDESEDSEEITVVERHYRLVKHRRKKYRCGCNAHVETADGPLKLIAGGRYSIDFALSVAIDKYLDHLPLERQVRAMKRAGLRVTSQTLYDQVNALADKLYPVYERLLAHVLEQPVIGADETTWRMLDKRGEPTKSSKKWYAWAACCENAVAYRIDPSRSTAAAERLLGDYRGTVLTDGYQAYAKLPARWCHRLCSGVLLESCATQVHRGGAFMPARSEGRDCSYR